MEGVESHGRISLANLFRLIASKLGVEETTGTTGKRFGGVIIVLPVPPLHTKCVLVEIGNATMKIHELAVQGDCDGVKTELAQGVSVDIRDDQNYTPLAHAAGSPDAGEEMLRLLIESGANINAAIGETFPLTLAACSADLGKVRFLLDAGAEINAESPKRYTALINVMYALCENEALIQITEFLVKNGAVIDCETDYGESPVSVASIVGRFDAVKFLLDAGADPSPLKWTELMTAIAVGSCEAVKEVLAQDSRLDHQDKFDRTPWLLAAFVGEVDKGTLLHAAGADVEERGRCGDTALTYCAAQGQQDMLRWLIAIGANLEAADDMGHTALMFAAQRGGTDCVRLLLEGGANPSHKSSHGENAMAMASNEAIVRLLIEAGEDTDDINTEMRRTLTGLQGSDSLNVSHSNYVSGRRPRFGESNPEVMNIPLWNEMILAGISAYQARMQFDDTGSLTEPVWCFSRFGMSITELPGGRFVQIGGEHEDYYDPDFCIYNEVVVHDYSGSFQIMGYPQEVFPPTDFHSATYVNDCIYIIGRLGYQGTRLFGTTPVFRLDCKTWRVGEVDSFGENPGWIYEHKATLDEPGIIVVEGGKICEEVNGEEQHVENTDTFRLDLSSMKWSRV